MRLAEVRHIEHVTRLTSAWEDRGSRHAKKDGQSSYSVIKSAVRATVSGRATSPVYVSSLEKAVKAAAQSIRRLPPAASR